MPYKNLVFQGGGSAGIAYIGALKKLEALELEGKFSFKKLERIAGASVGAITALLVALEYTADEIYQKIGNLNFTSFEDDKFGLVGDAIRLGEDYGVFDPDLLLKFIQGCIQEKTGNINSTFGDFKRRGFKDLYVVTTKVYILDGQGMCESSTFSIENAYDTSVAPTVLASASFPGAFGCARLDEVGPGCYEYIKSETAHAYIDGGVLNSIPEELFDDSRYLSDGKDKKDDNVFNTETLGLRLVDQPVIDDYVEHKPTVIPLPSNSPLKYIAALVNGCTSGQQEILFRKNHDEKRSIFINRLGVGGTATVDTAIKEALIGEGDKGVSEFYNVKPTPTETTQSLAKAFSQKRVPNGSLFAKSPAQVTRETPSPSCSRICTIL